MKHITYQPAVSRPAVLANPWIHKSYLLNGTVGMQDVDFLFLFVGIGVGGNDVELH